jgi:dihydropteroate synthase
MKFWQLRTRILPMTDVPLVMGIVNITPDSFSDGGKFCDAAGAASHAVQLVADGAHLLDIGGESTRPYSTAVSMQEELDRVIPAVEAICQETDVPVSIDTSKAAVAREALLAGAEIINDVTGLTGDPQMLHVALLSGAGICAMHMQGTPQTMQDDPHYGNVVGEIHDWLLNRRDLLTGRGIERNRICLDPGIGFGKSHAHNLELLANIDRFLDLECPVLVGHSRKGFIAKVTGDASAARVAGTLAVSLHLARAGVHVLRVHDVRETCQALAMQQALREHVRNDFLHLFPGNPDEGG